MAKSKLKGDKRVNVFLIAGEYDPVRQEPKHPRLIMSESDLKSLSEKDYGIQFIPKRWLDHENFKHDFPHLILRGNMLGIIVPSLELEYIGRSREEAVLLGSLPASCYKHSRHSNLIEANRKFYEAWKNFQSAYKELGAQLEIAKRKEARL